MSDKFEFPRKVAAEHDLRKLLTALQENKELLEELLELTYSINSKTNSLITRT